LAAVEGAQAIWIRATRMGLIEVIGGDRKALAIAAPSIFSQTRFRLLPLR